MQTYQSKQVAQALRDIADSIDDKTIIDFRVNTSHGVETKRHPNNPMEVINVPDGNQSVNIWIDYSSRKPSPVH